MPTPEEIRAIEADCEKQIKLYARLNDAADWDAIGALYTADARFARPTAPDDFVQGRDAIIAAFKARPARASRHVVSNIIVDVVDDTTATAFSVITLFMGNASDDGGLPVMAGGPKVGTFQDVLKLVDGKWLFAERKGGLDFA